MSPISVAEARLRLSDYLIQRCGIQNVSRAFLCLDPNHDDHHPSMFYNEKTKQGNVSPHVYCASCKARGDIFTVAGWVIGSDDFKEQLAEVESALGINLTDGSSKPSPMAHPKQAPAYPVPAMCESDENIIGIAQNAFINLYEPEGSKALTYLKCRGFDDASILRNGFGWVMHPREVFPSRCSGAPDNDRGWLLLPFPKDAAWSSVPYCVFRRMTQPGSKGLKEYKPKGLTQPLWNEYLLLSGEEAPVYVTEGVFDAVSVQALSGERAISLMGTGGVRRLLSILYYARPEQRPKRLILCLDHDDAGRKATQELRDGLGPMRVNFSVAPPFPNGCKDANEYLMSIGEVSA